MDFSDLLTRAREGDHVAVEALLERVEGQLRRAVAQRMGDRMRASIRTSDVLQNAYIEMLRSLPTFEGQTEPEFASWLTTIIEHDIQRQRRWFTAKKRKGPDRTSERNALAEVLLRPVATPSAEVAFDEERDRIERALLELSEEHQEVLRLVVFEELPHREAAARIGRSEAATRMLLHRARAALGLALEQLRAPPS